MGDTIPAEPNAGQPEAAERILFVTGKLAEPALRRLMNELAPKAGFAFEIAAMPITVAALLTTPWIARRLVVPESITRIVLPGFCRGELELLEAATQRRIERGPKDLQELPEHFGLRKRPADYGAYDIEILAEINHAPQLDRGEILRVAKHYAASGADVIDLGCNPGAIWHEAGDAVAMLKAEGFRVSIDSFEPAEVDAALAAGAELVLSVNGANAELAKGWRERHGDIEVVAIPESPSDLDSLCRTVERLDRDGVKHRLDPILEPIGFGFAVSLGRYLDVRKRFPDAAMMMGIGNLTELTDADSAGLNVLLAGFCQEQRIRSVLATEVINWGRTAVKEFDLARRLVFHAVSNGVLPKRIEPNLVLLRDPKLHPRGQAELDELAANLTDRNYRLFAERGILHLMNGSIYLRGTDPFEIFAEVLKRDAKMDTSHAFYLGYEFAKAVTALTLGKNYVQDRALQWGFLTVPEAEHRNPGSSD